MLNTKIIGSVIIVVFLVADALYCIHLGKIIEHDKWITREAELNAKTAISIKEAEDKARKEEQIKAESQIKITQDLHNKLSEQSNEKDRIITSLRSNTAKLFVDTKCPTGNSGMPTPTSNSTGSDGTARVELSTTDAEFLIGIGSEADKVASRLTACQAVIKNDRELIK